jgi:hypothetical protein
MLPPFEEDALLPLELKEPKIVRAWCPVCDGKGWIEVIE